MVAAICRTAAMFPSRASRVSVSRTPSSGRCTVRSRAAMLRQASSVPVGIRSKIDRISCTWPPITLTRDGEMWAS